jgi:cysteine desulfurase
MKQIYLDYAATTPSHIEVVKAMQPYFIEAFGNPSSLYSCGQEAKAAIEEARSRVAGLVGASDEEIVFTAGGTESDNFAIKSIAFTNERKGNHLITSSIEHHAVIESCRFLENRGFRVTYLPVDKYGLVDPADVKKAISGKTTLISIMQANNEVGTIEPIAEIGKIAKEAGVFFHSDAVQTAGHLPISVNELNVDLLSLSAHKLYGPKGVGALYIRKGVNLTPFIHGGEQEGGWRAGTENVAAIVGFGKAVEIAQLEMTEESERLRQLRDRLIRGIWERTSQVRFNGHPTWRLPNNLNMSFSFVEGEAMCLMLSLAGICVSTGSACSSSSWEPSSVLLALGLPAEQARSALRFTLGKWTTEEDIQRVIDVLPGIVAKLRAMSPLSGGYRAVPRKRWHQAVRPGETF